MYWGFFVISPAANMEKSSNCSDRRGYSKNIMLVIRGGAKQCLCDRNTRGLSWERLQHPHDLECGIRGDRKWTDG